MNERSGRDKRLWLTPESRASSPAPIPAVPITPSPSLGTELSGHPFPGKASLVHGTRSSTCECHLRSAAQPGQGQSTRHPNQRLSRGGGILNPGPCQGPGAPSAGSSAPAPTSFPRDLHPAGRQPKEEEEGGTAGAAQLWLVCGEGRGKLSLHHPCRVEAALSPRTGVWLCCGCFLKRRKGRDLFPDAKNREECTPPLGCPGLPLSGTQGPRMPEGRGLWQTEPAAQSATHSGPKRGQGDLG